MPRALVSLALLLAAAACGGRVPPGPGPVPLEVRVNNQNRSDVNVFLLRGGARTRLGTVIANDARVFKIRNVPSAGFLELQLEVLRIGAEGVYRTPLVAVTPGQVLRLRVEDLLVTSNLTVLDAPPLPARKPLP